jgi:RNA polymerase sigma factor (sigma-70 family)
LALLMEAPPHASPDVDATDDEALAARAQSDPIAFAPLYARYARPVYRYCYRRLGSHEAAEDATSQVFIRALAALPNYRAGTFRGWLFAIANNVVTDAYRRKHPWVDLDWARTIPDADPVPEEAALMAEERQRVQRLLDQLAPDQRRVVELRLAGLTGPEIARVLDRQHQAVKSLQFRAYSRLRRLLGVETRGERTSTHDQR